MFINMQAFYDDLVSARAESAPLVPCFVKLTQATPAQLEALKSGREWTNWG